MNSSFDFKARISGKDDSKPMWDSFGKSVETYAERLERLKKTSLFSPQEMSEFKKMFKSRYEDEERMEKKKQTMVLQGGQDAEDFARAALVSRHEDLALAEKLKSVLKRGQEEQFKGGGAFQGKMKGTAKETDKIRKDILVVNKNLKEISKIRFDMKKALPAPAGLVPGAGIETAHKPTGPITITQDGRGNTISYGPSTTSHGGALVPQGQMGMTVAQPQQQQKGGLQGMLGSLGGLKGALGKAGVYGAVAMGAYSIFSQLGIGSKEVVVAQMPIIRQLGLTQAVGNIVANRTDGELITNIGRGRTVSQLRASGLRPSDIAGFMGGYGAQMYGRTDQRIDWQEGEKAYYLSRTASAYGIDMNRMGTFAGMAGRFGSVDPQRFSLAAVGGAEKVGMGGARMGEFLDNLQTAITSAVFSGSRQTTASTLQTMTTLMNTSDERTKAMVPQMMESASGIFTGASTMQGGPAESIAFQAIRNELGPGASLRQIRSRLAQGGTIQNMRSMVNFASQFGQGMGEDYIEYMLQQTGMLGGLKDPTQISNMIDIIRNAPSSQSDSAVENELANKGIYYTASRLNKMGTVFEQGGVSAGVIDELKGLTDVAKAGNDTSLKIKSGIFDIFGWLQKRSQENPYDTNWNHNPDDYGSKRRR